MEHSKLCAAPSSTHPACNFQTPAKTPSVLPCVFSTTHRTQWHHKVQLVRFVSCVGPGCEEGVKVFECLKKLSLTFKSECGIRNTAKNMQVSISELYSHRPNHSWCMKEKLTHTFQDNFRLDSSLDYYNPNCFWLEYKTY